MTSTTEIQQRCYSRGHNSTSGSYISFKSHFSSAAFSFISCFFFSYFSFNKPLQRHQLLQPRQLFRLFSRISFINYFSVNSFINYISSFSFINYIGFISFVIGFGGLCGFRATILLGA